MGLIVNFLAAASVSDTRPIRLAAVLWFVVVMAGLTARATRMVPAELEFRAAVLAEQQKNTQAFLRTGQFPPNSDRFPGLPYPDRAKLAGLLSDEQVRRFLPSNLQAAMASRPANESVPHDRLGGLRDALLAAAPVIAIVGLLGFVFSAAALLFGR